MNCGIQSTTRDFLKSSIPSSAWLNFVCVENVRKNCQLDLLENVYYIRNFFISLQSLSSSIWKINVRYPYRPQIPRLSTAVSFWYLSVAYNKLLPHAYRLLIVVVVSYSCYFSFLLIPSHSFSFRPIRMPSQYSYDLYYLCVKFIFINSTLHYIILGWLAARCVSFVHHQMGILRLAAKHLSNREGADRGGRVRI